MPSEPALMRICEVFPLTELIGDFTFPLSCLSLGFVTFFQCIWRIIRWPCLFSELYCSQTPTLIEWYLQHMDVVTSLNCAALLVFWSLGLQSWRRRSVDLYNMSALPPRGQGVCTADLFREAALCVARFHREAGANIQWFISFACLRTSSQWNRSGFSHNDTTPS